MSCIQEQPTEGVRPNVRENGQIRPRPSVRATRGVGSGQHLASVLQEGRENANIDAGLGFIWRISVKGYSTVLSPFDANLDWLDASRNGQLIPMAKALLHPCLTKAGRAEVHKIFLEELDKPEAQDLGFAGTIMIVLSRAKKQGAIVDFIVHPAINEATAK